MSYLKLIIPRPPSVNAMFRNVTRTAGSGTGRVRSSTYLRWRRDAAAAICDQIGNQPPVNLFPGPVRISIQVRLKAVNEDIDNRVKAVLDLLVSSEILRGDDSRCVQSIYAEWLPKSHSSECIVAIKSV